MASHKHRSAFLDALNGKEVPIEITPQEVLSFMGVEAHLIIFLLFLMRSFLLNGPLTLDLCKLPLNAWVPRFMVLINNGSALNVCPFRTALTIALLL